MRTTLSGLTGYSPHYVMLVISASAGMATMTQEHLQYAIGEYLSKLLLFWHFCIDFDLLKYKGLRRDPVVFAPI